MEGVWVFDGVLERVVVRVSVTVPVVLRVPDLLCVSVLVPVPVPVPVPVGVGVPEDVVVIVPD